MNTLTPKEHYLVTQRNELIEARYPSPLTLNEKKIVLMMVSLIQPTDEDFMTYTISVKDYARLLGLDEKTEPYGYLRKLMKSLMQRVLEIPRGHDWLLVHWVSHCELVRQRGELSFTFHPKLKPYLLQVKNSYTQYQLSNVLSLTSVYSIAIYELIKKWERVGKVTFELEQFRAVIGATKPTYKKYYEFQSKILKPCQQEINQKTDISYSFEPVKSGRAVTHLAFTIHKAPKQIGDTNKEFLYLLALKIKKIAVRFELKDTVLAALLEQGAKLWASDGHIHTRFENELMSLCSYVESQKAITNPVGFIRWAFSEAASQENPTFMTLSKTEGIPAWLVVDTEQEGDAARSATASVDSADLVQDASATVIDYEYIQTLIHKKLDGTLTDDEERYLLSVTNKVID